MRWTQGSGATDRQGGTVVRQERRPWTERQEGASAKDSLEGTWQVVSLHVNGKEAAKDSLLDDQPVKVSQWTFTGNKLVIRAGQKTVEADCSLDPSREPKRIDLNLFFKEGNLELQAKTLGIYKVEGDTLTVCLADGGNIEARPLKFDTTAQQGGGVVIAYHVLRQETKGPKE